MDSLCRTSADDFERTYMVYKKRLEALAVEILQDKSEVDDILHDSLIKALLYWRKKEVYGREDFDRMLSRIVKNTTIDYYRRRKTRWYTENLLLQCQLTNQPSPEQIVVSREQLLYTAEIISHLDEKYQIVLRYRCFLHYTTEETARMLDIRRETVCVRLNRARDMIRRRLNVVHTY